MGRLRIKICMRSAWFLLLWLLVVEGVEAQRARTFILGSPSTPWRSGGRGIDPKVRNGVSIDTTNSPDNSIEFARRSGWISPLFFEAQENVASRVLERGASITSPDVGRGFEAELRGTISKFRDDELEHRDIAVEHRGREAMFLAALAAAKPRA